MGAAAGAKQFGQCLANMCRGNYKLSRKVSKVFIKAFNTSNSDNLKSYLKALKPFLRSEDEFKQQKLEWVFGFTQIVSGWVGHSMAHNRHPLFMKYGRIVPAITGGYSL